MMSSMPECQICGDYVNYGPVICGNCLLLYKKKILDELLKQAIDSSYEESVDDHWLLDDVPQMVIGIPTLQEIIKSMCKENEYICGSECKGECSGEVDGKFDCPISNIDNGWGKK